MGAVTYESIASQTVTGSATTAVTFSSISSSYTDIVVVFQIPSSSNGTVLGLRLNNDTGTNFSVTLLAGNGSAASSRRFTNTTQVYLTDSNNNSGETLTGLAHVMNYSNSSTYKTVLIRSGGTAQDVQGLVGTWRSTSAVNRVDIIADRTGINVGTVISLFGIKAS